MIDPIIFPVIIRAINFKNRSTEQDKKSLGSKV